MRRILQAKKIWLGLLACALVTAAPLAAAAQDVNIQAAVQPQQARVGEQIQLRVTIEARGNLTGEPQLPDLADFQVYNGGRSTSFNFINGQVSSSMMFTYVLVPKRSGQFVIGPITIGQGGKNFATAPITVTIGSAGQGYAPPSQPMPANPGVNPPAAGKVAPPRTTSREMADHANDAVFITTSVDRKSVYVNEPIMLTFRFFHRVPILSQPQYQPPDTTGFWAEDLPPQREYVTQVAGQEFQVIEIRTVLYPTTSGPLTISPAKLMLQIQDFQRSMNNPFADSFFRDFFSGGQRVALESKPIAIEVKPIPSANRPADFSGTVGKWSMSASLDRTQAKVGDAVTLEIRIFGEGNVKSVGKPQLPPLTGFKVYETVSSSEVQKKGDTIQGVKIYRTLLRPEVTGKLSVPSIAYSYFDPKARKFEQVKLPELKLEVLPGESQANGGPVNPVMAEQPSGPGVKIVAQDIRYLKTNLPLKPAAEPLPAIFWIAGFVLPPLLLLAFWGWQRHQDRLAADPRYARKLAASRSARQALRLARHARNRKDTREFYSALAQALTGYLADELGVSRSGITQREIIQQLRTLGASESLLAELIALFDEADYARFASEERDPEAMLAHEQQAEAVLTQLSRLLKERK